MVQEQSQRARQLTRFKRLEDGADVADVAGRDAPNETAKLLVGGLSLPRRLPAKCVPGLGIAFALDETRNGGSAEGADQLIFEVGAADEETEPFKLSPRKV